MAADCLATQGAIASAATSIAVWNEHIILRTHYFQDNFVICPKWKCSDMSGLLSAKEKMERHRRQETGIGGEPYMPVAFSLAEDLMASLPRKIKSVTRKCL